MALATTGILGAIGTAVSVAGTALGVVGSMKQAAASKDAEEARKKQMQLEAARARRAAIRDAIMARSVALSNATNQGAAQGSGLLGGYAQIQGRAAENVVGINQSEQIGNKIFDANARIASAGGLIALGQGLQGFGSSIAQNSDTINRLGTYYSQRPSY